MWKISDLTFALSRQFAKLAARRAMFAASFDYRRVPVFPQVLHDSCSPCHGLRNGSFGLQFRVLVQNLRALQNSPSPSQDVPCTGSCHCSTGSCTVARYRATVHPTPKMGFWCSFHVGSTWNFHILNTVPCWTQHGTVLTIY